MALDPLDTEIWTGTKIKYFNRTKNPYLYQFYAKNPKLYHYYELGIFILLDIAYNKLFANVTQINNLTHILAHN